MTPLSRAKVASWLDWLVAMPLPRILLLMGGYALLWCVLVFGARADAELARFTTNFGRYPVLLLSIAVGFAVAAKHAQAGEPRSAWAWRLLSCAFAAIALGDLVWAWYRFAQHQDPTLSLSNLFYLAYFPLILAGLLALPRVFRGRSDATMFTLDALTVAVGVGMVLWHIALRPALGAAGSGPWVRTAIALAYPIGDMVTVLGIAMVLLRQAPQGRAVAGWLALALLFSLVGDCLWIFANVLGSLSSASVSHFLWLIQTYFFLLAARAELGPRVQLEQAEPAWRDSFRWLPVLASVLGFGLFAQVARTGDRAALDGTLLAAGVLVLLVIARNMLGQREHAQLLAENIQRRGESRFAALIEHASDAIMIVDAQARVIYASPAAAGLVKTGADLSEFVHQEDRSGLADYLAACRRGQLKASRLQLRFGIGSNAWATTETTLSNLLQDPKVAGIVLNVRDVSERRALEEQLRFQAMHDPLSGLPNRALFMDRLARALLRSQHGEGVVGVAIVNIDQFKCVNDKFGHSFGDRVLAATAERLSSALCGADSLARLGGDEFAVLIENTGPGESIAQRCETLRASLEVPFALEGQTVLLAASAGLAVSEGVKSVEQLLRNADIALHEAKNAGGDRSERFHPERHARDAERIALEAALPQLLQSEAFALRFRPIVQLPERVPIGLLIELDWREHAQAPALIAEALSAARNAGLAVHAGPLLVKAVQRDAAALMRYVPEAAKLALHLRLDSAMLRDAQLPEQMARLLEKLELLPRKLVLEVDTCNVLDSADEIAASLNKLRKLGVSFALAGFAKTPLATGLLELLRFEQLILPESLLERIELGEQPGAVVEALLASASALKMRVLASGVSSAQQVKRLTELGCNAGMGDYLGPAMRFERVLTWLIGRYAEIAAGDDD